MASATAVAQPCAVPADYDTIQAAVNDVACTEIEIAAGAYYETVTITRRAGSATVTLEF